MMQRSDKPMGPYNEVHQLSHMQLAYNEPNQGGYLQDQNGKLYFFTHHGHGEWDGRIVSLLPVSWIDGWPIIGNPDENDIGNMVWQLPKPIIKNGSHGKQKGISIYQDLQNFTDPSWEWNYNPREGWYLRKTKSLQLNAFRPLESNNLLKAGNTLVQRIWRSSFNEVTVRMDCRQMADGQRSGICHFAVDWMEMGVKQIAGQRQLYFRTRDSRNNENLLLTEQFTFIYLRSVWGLDGECKMYYSLNGKDYTELSQRYMLSWGNFRGDRIGLFSYNDLKDEGSATFDHFRYIVKRENKNRNVLQPM